MKPIIIQQGQTFSLVVKILAPQAATGQLAPFVPTANQLTLTLSSTAQTLNNVGWTTSGNTVVISDAAFASLPVGVYTLTGVCTDTDSSQYTFQIRRVVDVRRSATQQGTVFTLPDTPVTEAAMTDTASTTPQVRKNKAWVAPSMTPDVTDPVTDTEYAKTSTGWTAISGLSEAPMDGKSYARKDGAWVEAVEPEETETLYTIPYVKEVIKRQHLCYAADGTISATGGNAYSWIFVRGDHQKCSFESLTPVLECEGFNGDGTMINPSSVSSATILSKKYVVINRNYTTLSTSVYNSGYGESNYWFYWVDTLPSSVAHEIQERDNKADQLVLSSFANNSTSTSLYNGDPHANFAFLPGSSGGSHMSFQTNSGFSLTNSNELPYPHIGIRLHSLSLMYAMLPRIKTLDINHLDTSAVTTFSRMFATNPVLESVDMHSLDTSAVTTCYYMFASCPKLTSVSLPSFGSSLASMASMFRRCASLKTLDLTMLDTSNVTNIQYLFQSSHALKSVNLSGCSGASITTLGDWLYGNTSLTSLIGDDTALTNSVWMGINVDISLKQAVNLDRPSIRAIINGLADRSAHEAVGNPEDSDYQPAIAAQDPKTLTLTSAQNARLTSDDTSIVTAKNWVISIAS